MKFLKTIAAIIVFLFLGSMSLGFLGCSTENMNNQVIEGTSLTIGLYIPYNGTIYGLQCVNYLSGRKIVSTNSIESAHSITNHTLGVFNLIETSNIKIRK